MDTQSNSTVDSITKTGIEVLYFSTPTCSVCKVLKPKIIDIINKYNIINK
mgnify:CR=1 FL=1